MKEFLNIPMLQKIPRSAGILLHPTSLATPYGIGDLGPIAYDFVNYLHKCGQSFWQVLPIGPTGYADSPYQSISAFAGNPLLISPDDLITRKLITKEQILSIIKENSDSDPPQWTVSKIIEYDKVRCIKYKIFEAAYSNYKDNITKFKELSALHEEFCQREEYWLEDFALFYSLRVEHDFKSWVEWPKNYKLRVSNALKVWGAMRGKDKEFYKFLQFLFDIQWKQLKEYANSKNVYLIGDMPIFVAHDSADVWSNSELFTLKEDGTLNKQAGVPPDYFSATGQLWGNPLYKWEKLQETNFQWLIQRFTRATELFDWIRIDHFRGFQAYWEIPAEETTAINGQWVEAPGDELFTALQDQLGTLPIIAEDLGVITPEVEALRDKFHFPGMKVLQFAFGGDAKNPHLPHQYVQNSLAYTGTHDNDTFWGWWSNKATENEKEHLKEYCNVEGINIVTDIIKTLYRSVANLAIIPIQDLLGLGSEARMNTPSVMGGNWQFKLEPDMLIPEKADWIKHLITLYDRDALTD